jgi:hypothetical protein
MWDETKRDQRVYLLLLQSGKYRCSDLGELSTFDNEKVDANIPNRRKGLD